MRLSLSPIGITLSPPRELARECASRGADSSLPANDERLQEACREFEGLLLGQMMRQMRGTLSGRGLIPHSAAAEVFWSQYCQALGQDLAQRSPLGLAGLLQRTATGDGGVSGHED